MNISIRTANTTDTSAIQSILNYGVSNKLRRGDLAWGDSAYSSQAINTSIQNGTAYIAQLDDQIVGTFLLERQDHTNWGTQPPTSLYLQRFAVDAGFRGQNIGGQILDEITSLAGKHNLRSIRLVCQSSNPKLRAYYENHGFMRADAAAQPKMPQTTIVYYERPLDGSTLPEYTAAKKSFLEKLTSKRLFRGSE